MRRIKNNFAAVVPDNPFGKIGSFEIADLFTPHIHYRVTGKVIAICDELTYNGYRKLKTPIDNEFDLARHRELVEDSMEWHTDLEVQTGDTVYFRLLHLLESSDPKFYDSTVIIDGQAALLIPYGDLIAKVKGNELYPLNGFILVEPIIENNNIGMFEIPSKRSVTEGVVRFVGKPNKHYLLYPEMSDMLDVKVGDRVAYPKTAPVRIEPEAYKQFGVNTALDRIQRRQLLGILKAN